MWDFVIQSLGVVTYKIEYLKLLLGHHLGAKMSMESMSFHIHF